MKRIYLYAIVLLSSMFFITSCEKDPIGGTAAQKMAGEWYVTGDAIDANGNIVFKDEDLFGVGHFHLDTYNTSTNSSTELWVNDNGHFWDFKTKINMDVNSMSFSGADIQNVSYDSKVTITNGKILLGAAHTPSGSVADSIVFTVSFNDDTYPTQYGYAAYRISGYRYTGLTNDN